ncbi:hypothetical protein [Methylobacterium sp. 77]|nr:hypothetical protein [Methylobacterium sp. 77]
MIDRRALSAAGLSAVDAPSRSVAASRVADAVRARPGDAPASQG